MKYPQIAATVLGILFADLAARSAELPQREKIAKDGWTIEFSPVDRVAAEHVALQVEKLEQIRAAAGLARIELEPAVIDARAEELAKKQAELCALPNRALDFQQEIKRMVQAVVEMRAVINSAASPRAVSIVRKSELIQRLQAGEKIPLFSYDAATNVVNFGFNLSFTMRMGNDYAFNERPEALASIPLKQSEDEKQADDPTAALLKDFQEVTERLTMVAGQMHGRSVVAFGFYNAVANVLSAEVPAGSSALWIQSGVSQWALRRTFVHALNPEQVESYLWYNEKQVQAMYQRTQRINLDENPGNLSAMQQAAAYAFFQTIAEKHGNEAVTKILARFWKLNLAERTSQAFATICEKQLKQPLAAYLPRGVVIEPVAEKSKI
jgi:hypothetical protein